MSHCKNLVLLLLLIALIQPPCFAQFGPAKVVTAKAEARPLPQTMTLVGTVEPLTRSTIGAEVSGLVTEAPAREGDLVQKGELICKINDDTLTLEMLREKARLGSLQAQLDELENGTRPETLARLKAEYQAAEALHQRWLFELNRIKNLINVNQANEKEYQDTVAAQLSAENNAAAAKALYDEALAGPRTETIAAARFSLAEQQAVVKRIESDLKKTEIRAPFTAHIVARHVEIGNWLDTGNAVVELADLSSVLIRVDAPEKAVPFASVGSPASARIDALASTCTGVIKHVIPQADLAARTFPIEIEVPNPEFTLKAGMFARATIQAGPIENLIAVPKDALIDNNGVIMVAVIVPGEDGKMAIPTHVTLGADGNDWIAVKAPSIQEGTEVAVYGNEQLLFPQPVVVVDSPVALKEPTAPEGQ